MVEKSTLDFYKDNRRKDGLFSSCKECCKDVQKRYRKNKKKYYKEYGKKWREKNKEKMKEYGERWYKNNRERKQEYDKDYYEKHKDKKKEYQRKYFRENKEKINKYFRKYNATAEAKKYNSKRNAKYIKERKKKDKKFHIDCNMSSAIYHCLRGKKERRGWQKLVEYTVDELMKHIEKRFEPWMNWDNYGKWHIDHIIPKSHFKYETAEDPEFKKCWALENLQPLEAIENIKKGSSINFHKKLCKQSTTTTKKLDL